MFDLALVDKLEVQILIDDVTDPLSSVPDYAESDLLATRSSRPVLSESDIFSDSAQGTMSDMPGQPHALEEGRVRPCPHPGA
jgi:hypothetical protein